MTDKHAPHNIEAEMAVLGSILIDPDYLVDVGALLQPGDFYREQNGWIFQAMLDLGAGLNQITVAHELQVKGRQIGPGYLTDLITTLPTSIHAKYYATIVRDCSYYRRIITLGGQIAKLGFDGVGTPTEVFEQCHELLQATSPEYITDLIGPKEHADRMFTLISTRRDHTEGAIRFGWPGLDAFVSGMYPGDYVVIGGRPSHGKTEIALEIARRNCIDIVRNNGYEEERPNKKILVASAEMSLEQLDEREIAMWGISIPELRSGNLREDQWKTLWDLPALVRERPMYYLEGKLTIDHIHQRAQLLQRTAGLDLVIIDYIQLLRDSPQFKARTTLDRISYISASTKNMARELKVPVIMLSQLNRKVEDRDDKIPRLSDLRESGTIEQDADIVLLLCRPELYDQKDEPGVCYVDVAKARQIGKKRRFRFKWLEHKHQYGELSDEPYTEGDVGW